MKTNTKKILPTIIIMLSSFFAEYFLGVYLARKLGGARYGDYAITIYIFKILAMITMLGASSSILRFIPEYMGAENTQAN